MEAFYSSQSFGVWQATNNGSSDVAAASNQITVPLTRLAVRFFALVDEAAKLPARFCIGHDERATFSLGSLRIKRLVRNNKTFLSQFIKSHIQDWSSKPPGHSFPRKSWVQLNRLQTGIGKFGDSMVK